jgi:signal transduction histidine kinase
MTLATQIDPAATQIASSTEPSMLQQIVVAVAHVTGSRSAYLERYDADERAEVLAGFGPDAPPTGSLVAPRPRGDTLIFPLQIDAQRVGSIVCIGAPHSVALDPANPGRIELLTTLAASALRNVALVRELELASSNAVERRFRLLNGLVHYLKNTLGAAGEYVQLIETESALTARQQNYVDASQRNIDVALRLLTELLDLGRVETGRLAVHLEPIDPNAVVRGIVRDYELSNGTSGVHFDLEISDALPHLETDLDLMRRILDTLLSNAAKYTNAGGRVTVRGSLRAGRRSDDPQVFVCITVTDQGPGVAEHDMVFEEVVRAESAETTPGFRLAISRRIARLLGGDLSLEPAHPTGSSFSLWLPVPSALPANEDHPLEGADADLRPALSEGH